MEKLTAECRYCGQVNVIPMGTYSTDEEKEIKATELCNCEEACNERKIKNANSKINEMFLTECKEIGLAKLTEDQAKILRFAVKEIVNDNALNITVSFRYGIKADIKINSKSEIEIKRTDVRASKDVVDDK